MLIDATDLYILILLLLTFAMIQGHRVSRKQRLLLLNYLTKFSSDEDEIWYAVVTCYDEGNTCFILF